MKFRITSQFDGDVTLPQTKNMPASLIKTTACGEWLWEHE